MKQDVKKSAFISPILWGKRNNSGPESYHSLPKYPHCPDECSIECHVLLNYQGLLACLQKSHTCWQSYMDKDTHRAMWPFLLQSLHLGPENILKPTIWKSLSEGWPAFLQCFFLWNTFGEGNSNPLQYSCLENPTDGGAWWATVHGVAKSRTRLSDFTSLHFGLKILLLKSHYGSGSLFCGNRTFKLALPENADGPKAYVLQMPLGFSQAVPWAGSGQEVFSALFQTALVPLNSS